MEGNLTAFWALIVLLDVGGLGLGVLLLRSRRDVGGRWRELWMPLAVAVPLLVLTVPLGHLWTGSPFAVLRLACHVLFCVLAPLLMAGGLMRLRERRLWGVTLLALGLGMDAVYVWAREIEPYLLQIRRHEVSSPAYTGRPLKIAVLADLQTESVGPYEEMVFDRVEAERPDLLLLPGDFLQVMTQQDYERERPRLVALFDRLRHRPPLGIFAVQGDNEWAPDALRDAPVRMLEDETARLDGVSIQVVGMRNSTRQSIPAEVLGSAQRFDGITIIMAHRPDFAAEAIRDGVDGSPGRLLCVAGHTHGGQIVVPGFGPPITFSRLPRRYAGGMHTLPARREAGRPGGWLLVSRGIGCERELSPRLRLFCPPELVFITLRGE